MAPNYKAESASWFNYMTATLSLSESFDGKIKSVTRDSLVGKFNVWQKEVCGGAQIFIRDFSIEAHHSINETTIGLFGGFNNVDFKPICSNRKFGDQPMILQIKRQAL